MAENRFFNQDQIEQYAAHMSIVTNNKISNKIKCQLSTKLSYCQVTLPKRWHNSMYRVLT